MNRQIYRLALYIFLVSSALLPTAGLSDANSKSDATSQVTEITLQRTWCYGRCPIDEVVLSADGTAKYTGKMNTARTGQYTGTFWKGEFEQLARWLEAEGFFTLKDSYGGPNIDAPDQIISVVRDGQRKNVINHIGASLELWGMERVIRGVASEIVWQPETSGIHGVVTWRPKTSSEFPGAPTFRVLSNQVVIIRPESDKQEFVLRTDKDGKFEIPLRSGIYTVEIPNLGRNPQAVNPQQKVNVRPDKFSDMTIKIDRLTEQTKQ